MFLPNNRCTLRRQTGKNVYGEPTWSSQASVPCAVVHLDAHEAKTSVRADSSASRGAAEERVSMAKILFPVKIAPLAGWKVEIAGFQLRIAKVQPRWDVNGRLDHYETELELWIE